MTQSILDAFRLRPDLIDKIAGFDFPHNDNMAWGDSETQKSGAGSNDAGNCIEISICYTGDGETVWYCRRVLTEDGADVPKAELEVIALELNKIFATRKLGMYGTSQCDRVRFERILGFLPKGVEPVTIDVFEPMNHLLKRIFTHDPAQRDATSGLIYVPYWGLSTVVRKIVADKADIVWPKTSWTAIREENAVRGKFVMDVVDLVNLVRFIQYVAQGGDLDGDGPLEI